VFEQSKQFNKLIGASALTIAGSAAFFSVFGLSKLFAGAQFAVIIMAGSLEFGKLVAASFLYRFWDKINPLHRTYMTIATVILVLITSAGIFGFLSNAYQGATVGFEKESTALIYKEDRLEQLIDDKKFLKEEMEAAISELPENYRTAKRKLREEYQPKINKINDDMINLKGEIGDLKIQLVETGVEVGPAIYLARVFDTDVDTVVKFFIFVLIFVFDPMAVLFVISYNVALLNEDEEPTKPEPKKKKWWAVYGENKKKEIKETLTKAIKKEKPPATIEGTKEEIKTNTKKSKPRIEKGAFVRNS
jgi:phage shock protein PspC (stress-responsive transcriptional regulator)